MRRRANDSEFGPSIDITLSISKQFYRRNAPLERSYQSSTTDYRTKQELASNAPDNGSDQLARSVRHLEALPSLTI